MEGDVDGGAEGGVDDRLECGVGDAEGKEEGCLYGY
jgi:hypothetical protein